MSNLKVYTFAVKRAFVSANADSSTPANWVEVPVVAESTINYTVQKAEVADGEGRLQVTWRFGQRAQVMLRMKQYAFNILERITGSPVSSAQGTDLQYFGRDEEISPPFVRLKLVQRANDSNNTEGYMHAIVFKAQGEMPTISMKETTPGEFTVNFEALSASFDENGNSIPNAYFSLTGLKSTDS